MLVISDTTPIITLIKAEQLDLLKKLFGQVVIPEAVFYELTSNPLFSLQQKKELGSVTESMQKYLFMSFPCLTRESFKALV